MTNYRQTMADALEFMYMMREYKLTERELTDDEKKRREEIAQGMDDTDFNPSEEKMSSFRKFIDQINNK